MFSVVFFDKLTGDVIHSSPAYADQTVYFGSWDSYLYALNAADGKLKWKFKTGIDTVYYNQVGFQSTEFSLQWRHWLAKDWGYVLGGQLYHNPYYNRKGISAAVFFDF